MATARPRGGSSRSCGATSSDEDVPPGPSRFRFRRAEGLASLAPDGRADPHPPPRRRPRPARRRRAAPAGAAGVLAAHRRPAGGDDRPPACRRPARALGRLHHRGDRARRETRQGRRPGRARGGRGLPPHLQDPAHRGTPRRPRLRPGAPRRGGLRPLGRPDRGDVSARRPGAGRCARRALRDRHRRPPQPAPGRGTVPRHGGGHLRHPRYRDW